MQRIIQLLLLPSTFFLLAALSTGCSKTNGFQHHTGSAMAVDSFIPSKGGLGTEILISGLNYTTDTNQVAVIINGHQLKVVKVDGRQIMAVVPAKCGSGHIIVKIGNDSVVSAGMFNYQYAHIVSTLAGKGTAGFANGNGTEAEFSFGGQNWYRSMGITVDSNLNVYVADPGNHCIRKIDSSGNVTTLAGDPTNSGYADGKGAAARFSLPYDVALDPAGNIWSVDPGNWDIRKIAPDGTAVTWAWGGQAPWSISIDPISGDPFYSSCANPGNVYQVTAQWNSSAIISGLDYPAGIRFDRSGNLYVVGNGDNVVHKFSVSTWTDSVIAGNGTAGYVDGPATQAEFSAPWGLGLDAAGNLYIAGNGTWDGGSYNPDQSIRYVDAGTRAVSTFAGSGTSGYIDGVGAAAAFSAPTGVCVDKNGTVYILDKNNNRIRKIITQ
ncbi:MAG TPA: IPT/TIG domain-containing protein [Puia sp.]|nr:IPT/TIG domain-containing protein [Puia sp.]